MFLHFQGGFRNDLETIEDGFSLVWSWYPTGVSHPTNGQKLIILFFERKNMDIFVGNDVLNGCKEI